MVWSNACKHPRGQHDVGRARTVGIPRQRQQGRIVNQRSGKHHGSQWTAGQRRFQQKWMEVEAPPLGLKSSNTEMDVVISGKVGNTGL